MNRLGTSMDGALYELVARGVKDGYFFEDSEKAEHPFRWRMDTYNAVMPEVRNNVPLFPAKWGGKVEWEMDLPADILTNVRMVCTLPSWLPPSVHAINGKSVVELGSGGRRVGYCNGIGYFLFEKIEIYQDGLLLQQVSGDSLYALSRTRGSWNQRILEDKTSGIHSGSALDIQRNATPGRMTLTVPFMGCQGNKDDKGFPICATRHVKYRIVATLRPFEKLIETSAGDLCYNPCGIAATVVNSNGGQSNAFTTLRRDQLGEPTLYLQTTQWYLSNPDRENLMKKVADIPFRRFYENIYYLGPSDYFSVSNGGTSVCTRNIDASFHVQQVTTYFRNSIDLMSGKYYKTTNDAGNGNGTENNYIQDAAFYAAGKTRESVWPMTLWRGPIQHATQEYRAGSVYGGSYWTIHWGVSSMFPNGGINFTSLDKPFLQFTLYDTLVNPIIGQRETRMDNVCESWAVFHIENGRGSMLFEN